jgi:hypothetical protein
VSLFVLLFLQMKWKKVQKIHFIDSIRDKHETWLSQVVNYFQFPSKGDLICSGQKVVLECTLLNTICSNWTGLYPSTLVMWVFSKTSCDNSARAGFESLALLTPKARILCLDDCRFIKGFWPLCNRSIFIWGFLKLIFTEPQK